MGRPAGAGALSGCALERVSVDLHLAFGANSDDGISGCVAACHPAGLAAAFWSAVCRGGHPRRPRGVGVCGPRDRLGCNGVGDHARQRCGLWPVGARHHGNGAGSAREAARRFCDAGLGHNGRSGPALRSAGDSGHHGHPDRPMGWQSRSAAFRRASIECFWSHGVHGWNFCLHLGG